MTKATYNFIDLFAGCGGLSEGFYKQDFNALTHVEIDKYACDTLKKRMEFYNYSNPDSSVLNKDITDKDIIEAIDSQVENAEVDLIIGGPPCQTFSTLGRARDEHGMQKDPRNFLFESYIKILKHFRPKFFVFENVVGLLSATVQGVAILQIILRELGKHYKLIEEPNDMVLNSVHYGVPQERRRLIILGVRRDIDMTPDEVYSMIDKTHYSPEDEAEGNTNGLKRFVTVHEAIADLPPLLPGAGEKSVSHEFPEDEMSTYAKSMRTEKELSIMDHVARRHNDLDQERYYEMAKNNWTFREMLEKRPHLQHDPPRVFGNSYVVQRWNRPAKTIIAHLYKDGNQFIHPDSSQRRTLTAREAARLQSFPDNFEFPVSRTQQYKQIGNAVPPLLAERIAIALRRALDQIKE